MQEIELEIEQETGLAIVRVTGPAIALEIGAAPVIALPRVTGLAEAIEPMPAIVPRVRGRKRPTAPAAVRATVAAAATAAEP